MTLAERCIRRRNKKINSIQKEIMVNFLENHMEMIKGTFSDTFTSSDSRRLWEELVALIGAYEDGPELKKKGVEDWKRTWQDVKRNVKDKVAKINAETERTGFNFHQKPLTDLDKRILALIQSQASEHDDQDPRLDQSTMEPSLLEPQSDIDSNIEIDTVLTLEEERPNASGEQIWKVIIPSKRNRCSSQENSNTPTRYSPPPKERKLFWSEKSKTTTAAERISDKSWEGLENIANNYCCEQLSVQKELLNIKKQQFELEKDIKQQQLELEKDIKKQQLELEKDIKMKQLELEKDIKKQQLELEKEEAAVRIRAMEAFIESMRVNTETMFRITNT